MRRMMLFLIASVLIAVGPWSEQSAKSDQPQALETSQQKEQYEKTMEERLGKLGKQLDELKVKTAMKSEEVRKEMSKYLAEAERKQKAASRKLEEVRQESFKKWKKLSTEMQEAMDDFERAYKRAKSHFKK